MVVINGLYILLIKGLLSEIKKAGREVIEKYHNLIIQFEEGNSGLREIINYTSLNSFWQMIEKSYEQYVSAVKKEISCNNITVLVTSLSKWIGLAVGIYFYTRMLRLPKLRLELFVGYQYMNQFSELFRQMNNYFSELITLMVKAEKIQNTIGLIHETDFENGILLNEKVDYILMKDISFSYDGKEDIIRGFSGTIRINEKNVIAGESGKGKSTLIDLFLKNYQTKNGDFIINKRYPLSQISLKSWLSKVSVVCQNPYIFLTLFAITFY